MNFQQEIENTREYESEDETPVDLRSAVTEVEMETSLDAMTQVSPILCDAMSPGGCDAMKLATVPNFVDRDKLRSNIDTTVVKVEDFLILKLDDADHVWTIDGLEDIAKYKLMGSEFFRGRLHQYKMRLSCNWRWNCDKDVWIYLHIYADDADSSLRWPFKRRVTISIRHKNSPNVKKDITKHCIIERPTKNAHRYCDEFRFSFNNLSTAGLMYGNRMIVQCTVHNE